jgi:glycosyltransferase involved in cell wall biosynthesis
VVVEALACGVPVVAGAEGGPLEILGPEAVGRATAAGYLVGPGDPGAVAAALAELLPPDSSTSRRRSRTPLRHPSPGRFDHILDELRLRGRGRPDRHDEAATAR